MRHLADHLTHSATDLASFAGCGHRTLLDVEVARGNRAKPADYDDPALQALAHLGDEHEQSYLDALRSEGRSAVSIEIDGDHSAAFYDAKAAETVEHMRAGVDVIHQAVMWDGTWIGFVDFLVRVDRPSDLGEWSYEVVDAKLARSAKAAAIVQVCHYSDMLAAAQGAVPQHIHLYLGRRDRPLETFELAHFAAYYRDLKRRFLAHLDAKPDELPIAADPVELCQICRWRGHCAVERTEVDHLSQVAGLARSHLGLLRDAGVETMQDLAKRSPDAVPDDVTPTTYVKLREQARIQIEARDAGEPRWEFLGLEDRRGLQALPAPSGTDWFFDFEGAPYALGDGLEYLWGVSTPDDAYEGRWALTRSEEKAALADFLARATERRARDPGFHIYHFGHYETTALKRLVARYGVGIDELDDLLRAGVFVDVHRIFVQAFRASVESYGLKPLEGVIGFTRDQEIQEANRTRAELELALTLDPDGDEVDGRREVVEAYNRDDCIATRALRDWIEARRAEFEAEHDVQLQRPEPVDPEDATDDESSEVRDAMDALLDGLPDDPAEQSEDEQVRYLAAHLLEWHRREDKQGWWTFFRHRDDLTEEELIGETQPLAALEYEGVIDQVKQSEVHRFRFPEQDFKLDDGETALAFLRDEPDPDTTPGVDIVATDEAAGTIDVKASKRRRDLVTRIHTLVPRPAFGTPGQRARLLDVAQALVQSPEHMASRFPAANALLRAAPPSFTLDPSPLTDTGIPTLLDRGVAAAQALDAGVLPVQGPPGTGKTFAGARMIVALLEQGRRVGIAANSHKVISNLLEEVCRAAEEEGVGLEAVQACRDEDSACDDDCVRVVKGSGDAAAEILDPGSTANLFAGTAWLWSREDLTDAIDVLVVDEAGQFALANAVAISHAASRMILLGDPQQLNQPLKGFHPDGLDLSVLDHVMRGEEVIPTEQGLFLGETWRMRPEVMEFTSELFYRSELCHRPETERQSIELDGEAVAPGLYLELADHRHNGRTSPEEAQRVVEVCERYLGGAEFTDREENRAPMAPEDLRVVAPYNAQVSTIRKALDAAGLAGVPVGTVDKFQGQEAPVAIYSLTSSSAEDAPRGMSFLYALDRLNVATSRAKVVTHLIASPAAFEAECRTPAQLRQLNAFLRFREMAEA